MYITFQNNHTHHMIGVSSAATAALVYKALKAEEAKGKTPGDRLYYLKIHVGKDKVLDSYKILLKAGVPDSDIVEGNPPVTRGVSYAPEGREYESEGQEDDDSDDERRS